MALVMLPCELPWWTSLQRHLKHLLLASSTQKLTEGMLKIHDMCNISLDPDEDERDPELFQGLADFLDNDLTPSERSHFMDQTLPGIVHRALQLRHWKPATGYVFSLQQQADLTELSYDFVSSLLAHAFFSTYPKRTLKTHPTLQDFNFTKFFKNLHRPCQKAKLRSILHYFDWLEKNSNEGSLKISRQVMSAKQWLTIEDWLECSLPLCRLQIKHDGRMERCSVEGLEVSFSNSRLGGEVLADGSSQEASTMCTVPDLLVLLLSVEALEDNEIVRVEGARRFAKIIDSKHKCQLEVLDNPKKVSICCMDPENYSSLPLGQYEEDNVLREMNKCLLGFQQKPMKPPELYSKMLERRLSPIGESFSHTPPEVEATVIIKQHSASTVNSFSSRSPSPDAYCAATINLNDPSVEISKRKCHLAPEMNTLNNRRGRFIVLGSSGECLPVKRPAAESCDSLYSSCNSSFDEFHSANTSVEEDLLDSDEDSEGNKVRRYSTELNTAERRASFAARLRDALRREMENSLSDSMSTDSSYAVGISVAGSGLQDGDIRLRRGGSGGFVLAEDSLDEDFLMESLQHEQEWISRFRNRRSPGLAGRDANDSSKYSFSTEYSSELEEVYEQFSQWLDDPIVENGSERRKGRELDSRDLAVVRFASSLLKRTLSESFAGVPLTDGLDNRIVNKNKLCMSVRSLSLELARHKHKLAAQLSLQLPSVVNEKEIIEEEPSQILETVEEVTMKKCPRIVLNTAINGNGNVESEDVTSPLLPREGTISQRSSRKSRTSRQSSVAKEARKIKRKTKLAWVIDCITDAIEQTIECEPITLKIQKSQLSQLANKASNGGGCLKPIITGNWGCGGSKGADPQLKLVIQWLAASVAGAPSLVYYTAGNSQLFKLDTLSRVLMDRKWTVGKLATAALRYAHQTIHEPHVIAENNTLFDELIGIDKCGNGD